MIVKDELRKFSVFKMKVAKLASKLRITAVESFQELNYDRIAWRAPVLPLEHKQSEWARKIKEV